MNILAEEKNVHRLAYAVCRSVDVSVAQCMDAAKDALRLELNAILSSPGKDGGQEVEAVGEAGEMPGSNGGFTMAAFKASDVPLGTKLYTRPQPASTALVERLTAHCQTCDDTGKEGRHSICRDCDESVDTQPADEIWIEPYPPADPIRGQDWSETNAWGQQATKYVRADIAERLTGSKDGGNDL